MADFSIFILTLLFAHLATSTEKCSSIIKQACSYNSGFELVYRQGNCKGGNKAICKSELGEEPDIGCTNMSENEKCSLNTVIIKSGLCSTSQSNVCVVGTREFSVPKQCNCEE